MKRYTVHVPGEKSMAFHSDHGKRADALAVAQTLEGATVTDRVGGILVHPALPGDARVAAAAKKALTDCDPDTTEVCVAVTLTVCVGVDRVPTGKSDHWWLAENVANWLEATKGDPLSQGEAVDRFEVLDVTRSA